MLAETNIAGEKIILAKPQTFMNKSGQAAQAVVSFYKIPLANVLIIHDDIDLLAGTMRLRGAGSSGGHNGLESVIAALGTTKIARIKIGIAEKRSGKQDIPSEDYVLQSASLGAAEKIKKSLALLPEIVARWLA